jgi:16S rRNA (cytosine1402-N4)-methyltransferase
MPTEYEPHTPATFQHVPVLLDEILDLLRPRPGEVFCDATIGGAGHASAIAEALMPDGRLIGIDRDPEAVTEARRKLSRFKDRVSVLHGTFSQIRELMAEAGVRKLDGLLVDLGVSSHQLDTASRGFSLMHVGPLDMRMDQSRGESASTLLAGLSEDELADIIYHFGGERLARPIARSIKQMESAGRLRTTRDLAVAVRRVAGRRKAGGIDAGTRTFQAIRIAVNDEMGEIQELLDMLPEPLAVGGRVAIISFHSGEDSRVKHRFKALAEPCVCPPGMPVCHCPPPSVEYITRRAVKVSAREQTANPRARSARVRAVRRIR